MSCSSRFQQEVWNGDPQAAVEAFKGCGVEIRHEYLMADLVSMPSGAEDKPWQL